MATNEIHVGSVVAGPLLSESADVLVIVWMGDSIESIGTGVQAHPGARFVADPIESGSA